jgi:hypothetical protein
MYEKDRVVVFTDTIQIGIVVPDLDATATPSATSG